MYANASANSIPNAMLASVGLNQPASDVQYQINRLEALAHQLDTSLTNLAERLDPVLGPDVKAACGDSAKAPAAVATPVSRHLSAIADHLDAVLSRMGDITSRLGV